MSETADRQRLDSYMDEYRSETSEGMGLKIENYEGGGNNMPDESEFYESRLEWLKETDGGKHKIWSSLAKGQFDGVEAGENQELVYIRFPEWFLDFDDKDDWKATFGSVYGYFEGWSILEVEKCEGKNAWAFSKFHIDGRWKKPHNQYGMLWGPRACFTLYRREGEPRPTDTARINKRDALPDEIDVFEADEDDYDWRLALGAAYRKTEGIEADTLKKAYNDANELPEKLYKRVELGVDEYMRQMKAEGKEVDDDNLAIIIETLNSALEPGATVQKKEE